MARCCGRVRLYGADNLGTMRRLRAARILQISERRRLVAGLAVF